MTASHPEATKVGQLLDVLWDPIGVSDGPPEDWAPFGEYESYVGDIVAQLRQGHSVESLAGYRQHVASVIIGVEPTGSEQGVASRLVAWYRDLHSST